MSGKIRALGMLSGGLDSTLATKLLVDQGIECVGINFYTGFCITEQKRRVVGTDDNGERIRNEALDTGAKLEVPVELVDISENYLKMVTRPRYGYGKNVNPCIDCRIHMWSRARELMAEHDARFIYTGEVLGQRPMSQHRRALDLIEKNSGLPGLILRPLSAHLLPPTIPEQRGWVDRSRLLGLRGRSRKEQMRLAEELGIEDYPTPAGGCCFLTDENYAAKFRDLVSNREPDRELSQNDVVLLGMGRHFRLGPELKIIVGRNEPENHAIVRLKEGRLTCTTLDHPGPTTLVEGPASREDLRKVAAITARYSDGKRESRVRVTFTLPSGEQEDVVVEPLSGDSELDAMRV
jgi:tRNA-specific 2-thiouridylase